PDDALRQLDALQRDYPLNRFAADAAYYRGVLLMSRQRGADALPLLLDAGASDQLATPHRANALRLAAMHQRHAGDTADAVATLGQLEQLVGRDGLTDAELLWLADHHLREDRPDTAIAYAKPVAEGRPGARAGA